MEDDRLIPLSYISQYDYCRRRVALLMLEQQWNDSQDTVRGSAEHGIVHSDTSMQRNGIVVIHNMPVVSYKLGLFGKTDAVEATESDDGAMIPFLSDRSFKLYPIEYKHGRLRNESEYELQLCAQAMCLEEMYGTKVNEGAVFYISAHRRKKIVFLEWHRENVIRISQALLEMLSDEQVPSAEYSAKCSRCSMKDICLPNVDKSAYAYLNQMKKEMQVIR